MRHPCYIDQFDSIFLVLGFEFLDLHFHWKDQIYQGLIDNTYSY